MTRPIPHPKRRAATMTREEFEHWFLNRKGANALYITGPVDVVPCRCGDVNCHGWRFVPAGCAYDGD